MELKDFITKTLLDISDGVKDAQKESDGSVVINPGRGTSRSDNREVQYVDFDIALSEIKDVGKSGKIGVDVRVFEGDGEIRETASAGQSTRVRFRVPIKFSGTH